MKLKPHEVSDFSVVKVGLRPEVTSVIPGAAKNPRERRGTRTRSQQTAQQSWPTFRTARADTSCSLMVAGFCRVVALDVTRGRTARAGTGSAVGDIAVADDVNRGRDHSGNVGHVRR